MGSEFKHAMNEWKQTMSVNYPQSYPQKRWTDGSSIHWRLS